MKYLLLTLSAIALVGCSIAPKNGLKQAELIKCEFVAYGENYINCYTGYNYYATNCHEINQIGGLEDFNVYSCNYGDEYYVFTEPSKQEFKQ